MDSRSGLPRKGKEGRDRNGGEREKGRAGRREGRVMDTFNF